MLVLELSVPRNRNVSGVEAGSELGKVQGRGEVPVTWRVSLLGYMQEPESGVWWLNLGVINQAFCAALLHVASRRSREKKV